MIVSEPYYQFGHDKDPVTPFTGRISLPELTLTDPVNPTLY